MKKFLHLKRSIVDSKNQPTIMQTYLDTIRSSCYKLATPNVSPKLDKKNYQNLRNLQEYSQKLSENDTTNDEKIINRSYKSNQILKFLSEKQSQQKQGSSQPFQSKCIWRKSPHKQLQSFSPKISRNDPELQICQANPQIQQIFQTLSSHCKSVKNQSPTSQKQIINTIMKSLELLNKKKQFQQSVQLIKNIIMSLQVDRNNRNAEFEAIANHSQVKDMDYIVENHENDIGINSQQNSHFKSCMQLQDQKNKNQISEDNQKRLSKLNLQKPRNQVYLNEKNDQQTPKIQIQKPFKIKYTVYKNNKKTHQGQSIYIQDPQYGDNFIYPQAEKTSRQIYQQVNGQRESSNSMVSQDINQWKNDQLYCIQQRQQEEDYKSSSLSSIVPQETIQFKKILYMLDSETTNKKPENNINPIKNKPSIRFKTRSTSNHSVNSVRSLFSQSISIQQQSINRGKRFRTQVSVQGSPNVIQDNQSQQTIKTSNSSKQQQHQQQKNEIQINCQSSMLKNKEKDVCKSIKSLKSSQGTLPLKSKDNNKSTISTNAHTSTVKIDKSKQLKQIVSMLSNKYNRTIKLNKN